MSTTWVIVATVLTSWIISESRDVAGWLAPRIVKWAARRLPPGKAAIREEEWLALLNERTGELKVFRFTYALSFCVASLRIVMGTKFKRWWNIETRAEFWLTEMDGQTASEGIVVSHRGKTYHFPWAPTHFKGPSNLDYAVEGSAPRKVMRYAGNLWSADFDHPGKWESWPPVHARRPWLWVRTVESIGLCIAVLTLGVPLVIPLIVVNKVGDWRRSRRCRRRGQRASRRR